MEQENIAPTDTQQPVKPTKRFNWLILGIVFVLAILASSVGTYYFLSQKNSQNQNPVTKTGNQNLQPTNSINSNISGTEGWIAFQDHCGISYQYPKAWRVDGDQKGYDTTLCSRFTSPDIKSQVGDVVGGQYMTISRIGFSAILYGKSTNIHSLDDYIKFMQAQITPSFIVADKTIGNITGKYYNYPSKASSDFAFEHGNYIYVVQWLKDYNGIYSNDTEKIVSTLKFTDQVQPTITSVLLKPADSQTPAAGICGGVSNSSTATITLNSDIPDPRCLKVSANQELQIVNNTDKIVQVDLGQVHMTINPKQTQISTQTFGSYLASGVHEVKTSLYGGSGPEIWLQSK